jgi:DNA invertase Pin-like site-specific DNA recombinase
MAADAQQRGWSMRVMMPAVGAGGRPRPQRDLLLRAARRRAIDAIVVWRFERGGRSIVDRLRTLPELQALGVGFSSLHAAGDGTTPTGRAMAGLVALFAPLAREMLRERVQAGIAHARRHGKRHGRPPTVAHQAPTGQRLAAAGLSQAAIARQLGLSRSSVRRCLPPGSGGLPSTQPLAEDL